jgi:hypothetical protein
LSRFELSLDQVVETVSDLLKKERKEILAHLERRIRLSETWSAGSHGEVRAQNFHRRLCALESVVRGLERELASARKAIR